MSDIEVTILIEEFIDEYVLNDYMERVSAKMEEDRNRRLFGTIPRVESLTPKSFNTLGTLPQPDKYTQEVRQLKKYRIQQQQQLDGR